MGKGLLRGLFLIFAATLLLCGCGSDSGPLDITENVVIFDPANNFQVPKIVEDDVTRLGLVRSKKWHWSSPDDWQVVDSTQFREVNLKFGENNEGECYVGRFGASSLSANINRWRKEMGAEPLSDAEIKDLPKVSLMGLPAAMVTVDGTFTARGGQPKEGYRLVAAIISTPSTTITVKMTGPKELLVANEANFKTFCASLDYK